MPHDNWLVEEKVTPGPEFKVRATYIKLLEQIIDALKESYTPVPASDMPTTSTGEELQFGPIYSLPTVIFAFLDSESSDVDEGDALMQLYCYRDRSDFLKELGLYINDEPIHKYIGIVGKDEPQTTAKPAE